MNIDKGNLFKLQKPLYLFYNKILNNIKKS